MRIAFLAIGVLVPILTASYLPSQETVVPNQAVVAREVERAVGGLPQEARLRRRWALVIAVGDYADQRIPDLPECIRDGKSVETLLIDPQRGMVPKDNIRTLLNADVTRDNVIEGLEWLARNAQPDDLVIVYFSGHGATDVAGNAYWLMQRTRIDSLRATAMTELDVTDLLKSIKPKQLVVLIDACFSAATANLPVKSLIDVRKLYKEFDGEGRVAITSSDGRQESVVIDDQKHPGFGFSAFTWHLTEALSGQGDTDADGVVTVEEVWEHVKRHVPVTARRMRGTMTPQLKGQIGGRFLLSIHPENLLKHSAAREQDRLVREKHRAALKLLAEDGKITRAQFQQAQSLLLTLPDRLSETDRKMLAEFVRVATGKLDPAKLGNALALHVPATIAKPPVVQPPQPPGVANAKAEDTLFTFQGVADGKLPNGWTGDKTVMVIDKRLVFAKGDWQVVQFDHAVQMDFVVSAEFQQGSYRMSSVALELVYDDGKRTLTSILKADYGPAASKFLEVDGDKNSRKHIPLGHSDAATLTVQISRSDDVIVASLTGTDGKLVSGKRTKSPLKSIRLHAFGNREDVQLKQVRVIQR